MLLEKSGNRFVFFAHHFRDIEHVAPRRTHFSLSMSCVGNNNSDRKKSI